MIDDEFECNNEHEHDVDNEYDGYDEAGDDPNWSWALIADQDDGDALASNYDGANDGPSSSGAFNMSSLGEALEDESSPTGGAQHSDSESEHAGW